MGNTKWNVAVKSENRGQGIGEVLLRFVEEEYFTNCSKLFLVVADFNPKAKRLYERIGYSEIGEIPDLYRKGISECLMIKVKEPLLATILDDVPIIGFSSK